MTGDFKVYGRGTGQGAYRDARKENLARFSGSHKPGQVVRGVFVRLEHASPGTAWVNFDGVLLLAGLPEDLAEMAVLVARGLGAGATPTGVREADFPLRNGDACYFVLESLEPEPVLRMLEPSAASGQKYDDLPEAVILREHKAARWRNILKLPLTQLAARYTRQRKLLEEALRERLWKNEDFALPFPAVLPGALLDFERADKSGETDEWAGAGSAHARYAALLRKDDAAQEAHGEMNLYRLAMIEALRPHGLVGFFFAPWLCPAAYGLELIFYGRGAAFALREPGAGNGESAPYEAVAGIRYKLQGLMRANGPDGAITQVTTELSGVVGYERVLRRELREDEPELMRFMLALQPQALQSGFFKKA